MRTPDVPAEREKAAAAEAATEAQQWATTGSHDTW